jgi:hypothetical protein
MTRVRFLRGTALGGVGNDAAPGDERDLPHTQAAALVATHRAVLVTEAPHDTPPATAVTATPAAGVTRKKGK